MAVLEDIPRHHESPSDVSIAYAVPKVRPNLENDSHVVRHSSLQGVFKDRGLKTHGIVHAHYGCTEILLHSSEIGIH